VCCGRSNSSAVRLCGRLGRWAALSARLLALKTRIEDSTSREAALAADLHRDEAALAEIPQVEIAFSVAGEDSHLLVVRTHSIAELSNVLQRLQGIDGVARTRTAVVLATPVRRPPTV